MVGIRIAWAILFLGTLLVLPSIAHATIPHFGNVSYSENGVDSYVTSESGTLFEGNAPGTDAKVLENEWVRIACTPVTVGFLNNVGLYLQDKVTGDEAYYLIEIANETQTVDLDSCTSTSGTGNSNDIINIKDNAGGGGNTRLEINLFEDTQGFRFFMPLTATGNKYVLRFYATNKTINGQLNYTDIFMPTGVFDADFESLKGREVRDNPQATKAVTELDEDDILSLKNLSAAGVTNVRDLITYVRHVRGFTATVSGQTQVDPGCDLPIPAAGATADFFYKVWNTSGTSSTLVQDLRSFGSLLIGVNFDCTQINSPGLGCIQRTCTPLDPNPNSLTCATDGFAFDIGENLYIPRGDGFKVEILARFHTTVVGTGSSSSVTELCTQENLAQYSIDPVDVEKSLSSMRYPFAGGTHQNITYSVYAYDADGDFATAPGQEAGDKLHINDQYVEHTNARAAALGDTESSYGYLLFASSGNFDKFKADRKAPLFDWAGNNSAPIIDTPRWDASTMYTHLGRIDLKTNTSNRLAFLLGYDPDDTGNGIKYGPHDINDNIALEFTQRKSLGNISNNGTYDVEYIPAYYFDSSTEADFLKNYSALILWGTHLDDDATEDYLEDNVPFFTSAMISNVKAAITNGTGLALFNVAGQFAEKNLSLESSGTIRKDTFHNIFSIIAGNIVEHVQQNVTYLDDRADSIWAGTSNESNEKINYHANRSITQKVLAADAGSQGQAFLEATSADVPCDDVDAMTGVFVNTAPASAAGRSVLSTYYGGRPQAGNVCGANTRAVSNDSRAEAWVYTNLSDGGKSNYVRVYVQGALNRVNGNANAAGGNISVISGESLREAVRYVQKKPIPQLTINTSTGLGLVPANYTADLLAQIRDRSVFSITMLQNLTNITKWNVSLTNSSGDWKMAIIGSNTSGNATFEKNVSGKILKVSLYSWEDLKNSAGKNRYLVSRDSKDYYNVSDRGTFDFEAANLSQVNYSDPNQISNNSLSQLRVIAFLNSDGASQPEIKEFAAEMEFIGAPVGNGAAFMPAKFWSHYNGEEGNALFNLYDIAETHVSNTTGYVKHGSTNLGSRFGNYNLYARFSDNRTLSNVMYDDVDSVFSYLVDKLVFDATVNNQFEKLLSNFSSEKNSTRLIANETLAMQFDIKDLDHAKGRTKDDSEHLNHGTLGDGNGTSTRPEHVTGVYGKGYQFDGNDFIRIPESDSLDKDLNLLSISLWLQRRGNLTNGELVNKPASYLFRVNEKGNVTFAILNNGSPSTTANWTSSGDDQASAFYGASVSSAGDVNNDGYDDIIVGAQAFDTTNTNAGKAYVYLGNGTGINTTPIWTSSGDDHASTFYGDSVSSAGDVNNDGYYDIIVGAKNFDTANTNAGKAYVYLGNSTGVENTAIWTSTGDDQAGALFGESVSSAGDINNDGYDDIIVGASLFDINATTTNAGKSYVYLGNSTGVNTNPVWTSSGDNQSSALFGQSVSSAGDINNDGYDDILVGADEFTTANTDAGKAYVYLGSASGASTTPIWTSSGDDQTNAHYGFSVSSAGDVNGDGYDDIIVGADDFDTANSNVGKSYVYLGNSTGVNTNPVWTSSGDNQSGALFGYSVSLAGDVNGDGYDDIIVGAIVFDTANTDAGKAYVYLGGSSGPATTPAWTSSGDNQSFADFSESISSAGDINNDGYDDIIVGASQFSTANTNAGKAYVYLANATSVISNSSLRAPQNIDATVNWTSSGDDQASAFYGVSVSSAGDVNNDGFDDIIVGAADDSGGPSATIGKAYVYLGRSAGTSTTPIWTSTGDNQAGADYGSSVSSAGDVNNDGFDDIIVGAFEYNTANTDAGKAYVYLGSSSGPATTPIWTSSGDNQASANYGSSVSSAGDVNNDGYDDIIVGAYQFDTANSDAGKAYVYLGSSTGPATTPIWTSTGDNQASAKYGTSVSSAGDVNNDGYDDIIIGAAKFDTSTNDVGKAYVYFGSSSGVLTTPIWTSSGDNQLGAEYGTSVSSAGDVNNDGYDDIIVGAHSFDTTNDNAGKAYVYLGSSLGLENTPFWASSGDDQTAAFFGSSVSSAGDVNNDSLDDILVGASKFNAVNADAGKAYVYLGSSSGVSSNPVWNSSGDDQLVAEFGKSVSSAGDVNGDGHADIVVGSWQFNTANTDAGKAYVYRAIPFNNTWTYVTGVYNGTDMSIYFNATLDATKNTGALDILDSSKNLFIGKNFVGFMDDLRIYNDTLSAGEIDSLRQFSYFTKVYKVGDTYNLTIDARYAYNNTVLSNSAINSTVWYHKKSTDTYPAIEQNTSGLDMFASGTTNENGTKIFTYLSRTSGQTTPAIAGRKMLQIKASGINGISHTIDFENFTDLFRTKVQIKNITFFENFTGTLNETPAPVFNRNETVHARAYILNPSEASVGMDFQDLDISNFSGDDIAGELFNATTNSTNGTYVIGLNLLGNYSVFANVSDDGTSSYTGDGVSVGNTSFNVTDILNIVVNSTNATLYNRGEDLLLNLTVLNVRNQYWKNASQVEVNFTYNSEVQWREVLTSNSTANATNQSGNFSLITKIRESAKDSYTSTTAGVANDGANGLNYVVVVNTSNNTGTKTNIFDVDSNYYFSTDNVLFSTVMRDDVQRVNASFLSVRNSGIMNGVNVTIRLYDPLNALIYSNNKTTSSGTTYNFDQKLSNADSVGTWQLKYVINESNSGNFNNSLSETSGGTFVLNNTISFSDIVANILGESNTQKKLFNLAETINISGTLKHSDGGFYRIKSPIGNGSRNLTIQIFNNTYGANSLQNSTILGAIWQNNLQANSSLTDVGTAAAPTIFDLNGTWYLVSGNNTGMFTGFKWNGNTWEYSSAIGSGLGDIGSFSKLDVFERDTTFYLIASEEDGTFSGFHWSGASWASNSSAVSGLTSQGTTSVPSPSVFYMNNVWHLIAGKFDGTFVGFSWDSTISTWASNSSIVSGLGDIGAEAIPTVFQKHGTWYLISGDSAGTFNGFNWSNSQWQTDNAIVSTLGDAGTDSAPNTFLKENVWQMVAGKNDGTFNGYLLEAKNGTFNAIIAINLSTFDTYASTSANQTETLNYDIRFFDGNATESSNTFANDGNAADQFDVDHNLYPEVTRGNWSSGSRIDIYNRGETVAMNCNAKNVRNNSLNAATVYFRLYNGSQDTIWFNSTIAKTTNSTGNASEYHTFNSTSTAQTGWQSYCNSTLNANNGSAFEANTFEVSNQLAAEVFVNDAAFAQTHDADFNTGIHVDSLFATVILRNARSELTNLFDNIFIETLFNYPNNGTQQQKFNLTTTNQGSSGEYRNTSSLTTTIANFQNQTSNATFTVLSSDTKGNTVVTGSNSQKKGKLHFLATNVSVNDTHILRTQDILFSLRAYDSWNDTADDGKLNASSGLISDSAIFNASVYFDDDHSTYEDTYQITGVSPQTQVKHYASTATTDHRDVRVNASVSALDLDGLTWNLINNRNEPAIGDDSGIHAVDDLKIVAISSNQSRYDPPATVKVVASFAYTLAAFVNQVAASEYYNNFNATLFEQDGETGKSEALSHASPYYNQSTFNVTSTNSTGNATFAFNLLSRAEAGQNWRLNVSTFNNTLNGSFDVNLVINATTYYAHPYSSFAGNFSENVLRLYNRGEEAKLNVTFANNPEQDSITSPVLYDLTNYTALNSTGGVLWDSNQRANFTWNWSTSANATNNNSGAQHHIEGRFTINGITSNSSLNQTTGNNPNVSSLLFIDAHTQLGSTLNKDADPAGDNGNLRDNASLKDSNEDTNFIVNTNTIYYWAHVQNIRGENLQTSGTTITLTLKDVDSTDKATGTADTASDGWTSSSSFLAASPLGKWQLHANISNLNGNVAGDIQQINIARLLVALIEVACSQKSPLQGTVLCSTYAYDPKTGLVSAQLVSYNITNSSGVTISEGSGVAQEVTPNSGVYSFTFTFDAPSEGNYFTIVNTSGTADGGNNFRTAASTSIYVTQSGLNTDQNQTLYGIHDRVKALNTTLLAVENFGSNNLTELKEKLVDLQSALNTFKDLSKENVFLVTDSVMSVNSLLDKAEEGDLEIDEAKSAAKEIRAKISEVELKDISGNVSAKPKEQKHYSWKSYLQIATYIVLVIGILYILKHFLKKNVIRKHHHGTISPQF